MQVYNPESSEWSKNYPTAEFELKAPHDHYEEIVDSLNSLLTENGIEWKFTYSNVRSYTHNPDFEKGCILFLPSHEKFTVVNG